MDDNSVIRKKGRVMELLVPMLGSVIWIGGSAGVLLLIVLLIVLLR